MVPGKEDIRQTQVPITLTRASLGNGEVAFALVNTVEGVPNFPAYLPKERIIVDEQPVSDRLKARLTVEIVSEHPDFFVVEARDDWTGKGARVRWRLNKEQGKIQPASFTPNFKA